LINYIHDMVATYRGNHMFMPFGCDFTFANARMNFDFMDKMIKWFNAHNDQNITLLYSTPGEYIDALKHEDVTWPVKYDDMFPYADNPQDYWTGYFSSRQASKRQVRDAQANLHSANYLYSLEAINQDSFAKHIEECLSAKHVLLDALGVNQHHDAITGTAKQANANDYVYLLSKAQGKSDQKFKDILEKKAL